MRLRGIRDNRPVFITARASPSCETRKILSTVSDVERESLLNMSTGLNVTPKFQIVAHKCGAFAHAVQAGLAGVRFLGEVVKLMGPPREWGLGGRYRF